MRSISRKLSVLGLSALAMAFMVVGPASAQAGFTVYDYESSEPCPELVVEGNDVSGGCLVEGLEGTFSYNYFGSPMAYWEASFDIRIDAAGKMYAVNQAIADNPYFERRPCEDEGEVIPWEAASIPTTINFCIEQPISGGFVTQVVPFYVEGNYGTYGYIESMYQTDDPEFGMADANFENTGDYEEVVWEWTP